MPYNINRFNVYLQKTIYKVYIKHTYFDNQYLMDRRIFPMYNLY